MQQDGRGAGDTVKEEHGYFTGNNTTYMAFLCYLNNVWRASFQ